MTPAVRYGGIALLLIAVILGVALATVSYSRHTDFTTINEFSTLTYVDAALFALSVTLLAASLLPNLSAEERRGPAASAPPPEAVPPRMQADAQKSDEAQAPNEPLTALDITLLQNLQNTGSPKQLSNLTGVDPDVISDKLDRLSNLGYLTKNTKLTEKGFDFLNSMAKNAAPNTTQQPTLPTTARSAPLGLARTDYYRIVAGIGVLLLLTSLFCPWIASLSSGVSASLADIYNFFFQAILQEASGTGSTTLGSPIPFQVFTLIASLFLYPTGLVLSALGLRYRTLAPAGGISAIIASLLFIFSFDSLQLSEQSQIASSTSIIVIGYGAYLAVIAGITVTISYYVSKSAW
jgi:hypothetical protein